MSLGVFSLAAGDQNVVGISRWTNGTGYLVADAVRVSSATGGTAGQRIGTTGNTGNSTGPHLHFGIRTGSIFRCPQNFLLALYDGVTPPAATSLPTSGCSY